MAVEGGLRRRQVEVLQKRLREWGVSDAPVTGLMDSDTEDAIALYMRQRGLPVDTVVSVALLRDLDLMGDDGTLQIREVAPLSFSTKGAIVREVSRFGGGYGAIQADLEFEGVFDHPIMDGSEVIPPEDRAVRSVSIGVPFAPERGSKYGHAPEHRGLRFGIMQFRQDTGSLGRLLAEMRRCYRLDFDRMFGPLSTELLKVLTTEGEPEEVKEDGLTVLRYPSVRPVGGADIWCEPWLSCFREAGRHPGFRTVQVSEAVTQFVDPVLPLCAEWGIRSSKGLAIMVDLCVRLGVGGARREFLKYLAKYKGEPEDVLLGRLSKYGEGKSWGYRVDALLASVGFLTWLDKYEW